MQVSTPLCATQTGDMTDCMEGCPIVDELDIEISLGGGWRHFAGNQPKDIVTPGVRADIDRYHHEVFGEPLNIAPLPDLENIPPGGYPVPSVPEVTSAVVDPECDCSCEALEGMRTLESNPMAILLPENRRLFECLPTCVPMLSECQ